MRYKTVYIESPAECPFRSDEFDDYCKLKKDDCISWMDFSEDCPLEKCKPAVEEVYGDNGTFLFKCARIRCRKCGNVMKVILVDKYAEAVDNNEDVPSFVECLECKSKELEWIYTTRL